MAQTIAQQPQIDPNTQEFLQEAQASKFDFHSISTKAAGDERLKTAINNAVLRQYTGRQLRLLELPDSDKLRTLAGEIKQHALAERNDETVDLREATVVIPACADAMFGPTGDVVPVCGAILSVMERGGVGARVGG